MSVGTHAAPAEARDDLPVDRLYRLSDEQYRRMVDSGVLDEEAVERRDGILSVRHPASPRPSDRFFRMSVEQYDEAARLGILNKYDLIELIEGWLVTKMSKKPPHTISTNLLRNVLARVVPEGWYVGTQDPIATGDSEPEPDALLVRGDFRDYPDRHPGPGDVALVVEVADSTLSYDRSVKQRIYARAGVTTYWIVNLVDRQVEVHTEPSGPVDAPGYARREVFGPDAEIPIILDDREVGRVAVCDVLP
jgi:Uma2 family endonuclease